jgi:hypothetical protein
MLSASDYLNPQHWLARAQEARAMADPIDDQKVKKAMFAIAESYEKIATRADLRKSFEGSDILRLPSSFHLWTTEGL